MTQNTLKTWLIARSFTKDEHTLARYARYIANEGMGQINEMLSSGIKEPEIVSMIENYERPLQKDNVYISCTPDMIYKYGAINYIGSWNIIDGAAPRNVTGVDAFSCTPSTDKVLNCSGIKIDLAQGLLNDSIPLKTIEYLNVSTGQLERKSNRQMTANDLGAVVVQEEGISLMIVIAQTDVYNSAFFRLFVAGDYDRNNFEPVITNFPLSRVYKLK